MHAFSWQEQKIIIESLQSQAMLRVLPSQPLSAAHQIEDLGRRTDAAQKPAARSAAASGSYAGAQYRLPPSLRNLPCSVEAWSTPRD